MNPARLTLNTGGPTAFNFPSPLIPVVPAAGQLRDDARLESLIIGMETRLGGKMDDMGQRVINVEKKVDDNYRELDARITSLANQRQQPPPPM